MLRKVLCLIALGTFAKTTVAVFAVAKNQNLSTVSADDLNRYGGTWYEIARLPNRFEKDCAANVTATYTLRSDKKIEVLNQCQKTTIK